MKRPWLITFSGGIYTTLTIVTIQYKTKSSTTYIFH